jgi:hypothetical protein
VGLDTVGDTSAAGVAGSPALLGRSTHAMRMTSTWEKSKYGAYVHQQSPAERG